MSNNIAAIHSTGKIKGKNHYKKGKFDQNKKLTDTFVENHVVFVMTPLKLR